MKPEQGAMLVHGVWFQSAVSGLWYQERRAAGGVSCVKVDGMSFLPVDADQQPEKPLETPSETPKSKEVR